MNADELTTLKQAALDEVAAAADPAGLESVRIHYLGRKGVVAAMMKELKTLPPEQRGAVGKGANLLKQAVLAAVELRVDDLKAQASADAAASFDFSLPGHWTGRGSIHPVSRIIEDACAVFSRLGFTVADGPDIETRFHNFDALNTAAHHPSLDEQDTFWLSDGRCLRTQTSPVQIRVMRSQPPPVRIVTPGRCYRRDTTDATHSANFHQLEGLFVDTSPVSLADLKGTLAYFARELMGPDVDVRFRPHFFPFTEPSVEVDFSCHLCGGKGCNVCKHSGWIEIAGAGIVDPRVFGHVGYDPEAISGYAFGMGVERIAMIKYGIRDIRHLYENDLRFLSQFA